MVVYLNGSFVPEEQATVSVFDRAFLYGDSLFETMRIRNRRIFRWHQHLERFFRSVEQLQFHCPTPAQALRDAARRLIEENQISEGLLRLTLTRGVGPRGYSPKGAESPSLVMTVHPPPVADPDEPREWRLITSTLQLAASDRLAVHKTGSKFLQIMARMEAEEAGADEALLVNTHGEVAEGSGSNLFWVHNDTVYTAPTAVAVLPGVTRAVVLELCASENFNVRKRLTKLDLVKTSDALFLTNSVYGIVDVLSLDDRTLPGSPIVTRLQELYTDVVRKECGLPPLAPPPAADDGPGDQVQPDPKPDGED